MEDERRSADQVTLAMKDSLVSRASAAGCSAQLSDVFQASAESSAAGFTSTSAPFASSSVSRFFLQFY